jgi:hypothetical protein
MSAHSGAAFRRQDDEVADLSPLVGTEVRQLRLDYQVTLLLVDGPNDQERASGLLQIETPFRLETDGQTWTVVPSDKSTHAPVCHLVHLTVVLAEMDDDGRLRLRFSDGSALTVERDPRYESWNLTGSGVPVESSSHPPSHTDQMPTRAHRRRPAKPDDAFEMESSARLLRVLNIAWGYDSGDHYAHITTNCSPFVPGYDVDLFFANEIRSVEDGLSGEVVWRGAHRRHVADPAFSEAVVRARRPEPPNLLS